MSTMKDIKEYDKSHPETIQDMFASIAERYDRANAVLSMNLHKYWNRQLVKLVSESRNHANYLDLCSGTGDIAFEFMKLQQSPTKVHFLDFCPEMLKYAKIKAQKFAEAKKHELEFIQGDAQQLPFDCEAFDCITVAYGIRNVEYPEKCFKESYRILKPGGVLGILELTRPSNIFLRLGHTIYLKTILPLLGKLVAHNKEAYEYLCSSIHRFTSPERMMSQLLQSNFSKVKVVPLLGGVATITIAQK